MLDTFFGEVVQAVVLYVAVLSLAEEPAKLRLEEDVEPVGIDGCKCHEIVFVFFCEKMFISTPKDGCRV